jgi:two-component system sensor histidine kinase VicK
MDPVWFVYDLTTQGFTYLGPTFEAIWKRNSQGLLDNPDSIIDTIHADDKQYVLENYKHFIQNKESLRLDFRIMHPDGSHRWIALKSYPIKQQREVTQVAGLAEDDTPRKENLLYLQIVNGKKNVSLEIISHDLSAPLRMIQSLVDLIEKDTSPLSGAKPLKYLALIRGLCKRNMNLIKNLINEEYLASPQVEIDLKRLDLVADTKAVMEQYEQSKRYFKGI